MSLFQTHLNPRDEEFKKNTLAMQALVAQLKNKIAIIEQGGGLLHATNTPHVENYCHVSALLNYLILGRHG